MQRTRSPWFPSTRAALWLFALSGLAVVGCGGGAAALAPLPDGSSEAALAQSLAVEAIYAPATDPGPGGLPFNAVLTDSSGTPVAGADVFVGGEFATITAEDGSYAVVMDPALSTIEFGIGELIFHSVTVDPLTRSVQQRGDPGEPSRGALGGAVMNQFGPVDNGIVVFFNRDGFFRWTTTGEAGRYSLGLVPAGPGVLAGFARMHDSAVKPIVVQENQVNTENLFLQKNPALGHLVGLVLDVDRGEELNPIQGARVTLYRQGHPRRRVSVGTNRNGAYFFGRIPPGDYVLVVRKEGYCPAIRRVSIEAGRNLQNVRLQEAGDERCRELPGDWPGDEGPGDGFGDGG